MDLVQSPCMIHFHNLGQKQLNDLLKVTKSLHIDCCYLGHQEVSDKDLFVISSSTRFIDMKKLREKYSNGIFLVIEKKLSSHEINLFNELGNIFYVDEINNNDLISRIDLFLSMKNLKKTEERDNEKEKSQADNEQTLAIISHDLKNPLNAIRLDAQILIRNAKKSGEDTIREEVKHFATRIVKTTDRLALMISDLLEGDKGGDVLILLSRTLIDAEKLIDDVIDIVSPIAKRNSIKIKKNILGKIPSFTADKNKVFQVLLNLMSNALKFSHQHTSVQVSVKFMDNKIHFSVEDSGPGIDPQIESVIYERYSSGSRRGCGTGLGLYICKTIVEAHQGSIIHTPGSKGGTVFEFCLPMVMEISEINNKKIYLIDEDEDLREVLSWALNSEGYHVESFSCPELALHFLTKNNERPAMFLSDFHMAKMKVQDFIEQKKLLSLDNVPLFILTTSPSEMDHEIDRQSYSRILSKPLDLDALILTVSQYMNPTCTQSV